MKKRILLISLAIVLCFTLLVPATALAWGWPQPPPRPVLQHFNVVMTPSSIDNTVIGTQWPVRDSASTNVWPIIDIVDEAPATVGWIINGRSVYGTAHGTVNGNFSMTYGGVVDVLQSGSMDGIVTLTDAQGRGTAHLSADGTIDTEVVQYYSFGEIVVWCPYAGMTIGEFFAAIYGLDFLIDIPEGILQLMYDGTPLPPPYNEIFGDIDLPDLPKILSAVFSGRLVISAGTGIYSGVKGTGQFGPLNHQPLTLTVYPSQHVENIAGSINMSGFYTTERPRLIAEFDREDFKNKLKEWRNRFQSENNDNNNNYGNNNNGNNFYHR